MPIQTGAYYINFMFYYAETMNFDNTILEPKFITKKVLILS